MLAIHGEKIWKRPSLAFPCESSNRVEQPGTGMARTAAIKYRLQCLSVPSLSTLHRFGESNVGLAISVSIASVEPIFPNALTNEGCVAPVLDTTNMCN